MKDIGYTQKGNRLVEMNEAEYAQFSRLRMAVEGQLPGGDFYSPREFAFIENYDFSNTFEVVRAFYESRFRVTELQRQLDAMKESLSK